MPGRKFTAGSAYRYGFNGKENDKDISEGSQDYGMRIYDARLGRFLSVDPLTGEYPWNSTYAFAENDVIRAIDIEGAEKYIKTNYRNAAGVIYKTEIQCIENNKTKKAVLLNFYNASGQKLTSYDVYESDVYDNGKVVDVVRPEEYQNKLSAEENQIFNSRHTEKSQVGAPEESDSPTLSFDNILFGKGKFSSKKFNADLNTEKLGFKKYIPVKEKQPAPQKFKISITEKKASKIDFQGNSSLFQGTDYVQELNDIIHTVKASGVVDYSITIIGNTNGRFWEDFNSSPMYLFNYETLGDLALARANQIKNYLCNGLYGLDPSKVKVQLGDPQKGMNADYKITTTTIK